MIAHLYIEHCQGFAPTILLAPDSSRDVLTQKSKKKINYFEAPMLSIIQTSLTLLSLKRCF